MPKGEIQQKTVLLVDLCVTDGKSSNDSTVWVESVCLNPSLTSLAVCMVMVTFYRDKGLCLPV